MSSRHTNPTLKRGWPQDILERSAVPAQHVQPDIGFTLFTPIKGRIDSLTVYIYKVETCTNILRYNTCMSSYPGDRKWTTIEP